jgi:indolepyruvate ferredoxin oxidoreductase, beta subunit
MEKNILIAGVGGQGILSIAFVICNAALKEKLNFKQAEVHGMAQRGGAVQSNLRLSDGPVASDLIAKGACDLIISAEPLEVLRYLPYLKPDGVVVTSMNSFVNIPDYPEMDAIWAEMKRVRHVIPLDAEAVAKKAGSSLAQGMVVLGASSWFLPLRSENLEEWVGNLWKAKGERVMNTNLAAYRSGRELGSLLRTAAERGASPADLRAKAREWA